MKCNSCEREDVFSVSRNIVVTEYRNVHTDGKKPHKSGGGWNNYKTGGWKVEEKTPTDKMFLRCNACESEVLVENLKGIGEIKIDDKKGVVFVSNMFESYSGKEYAEKRKYKRRSTDS